MKIQVMGSGCDKCKKLFELTKEAVKQLGVKADIEYVTDVEKIIEMGIMGSPVLAIDGKATLIGFLPDIEKIKKSITTKLTIESKSGSCSCGGKC